MSNLYAPAAPVRRRLYFLRDLAAGRGEAIRSELSARDEAAEYRTVISPKDFQSEWRSASALLVFAGIAQGQGALFTEVRRFRDRFATLPTALLTDSDDLTFLKSCYAEGISQVLQTTLPVSIIVQSLRMISPGRAFVPMQLLVQAQSNTR